MLSVQERIIGESANLSVGRFWGRVSSPGQVVTKTGQRAFFKT